jgi:thiosulfate/3-mercaptopyruvate sulfurtransferase
MRKATYSTWLVVVLVTAGLFSGCAGTEKIGVTHGNVQSESLAIKACSEAQRGGYKLISLQDLKKRLDAKEKMLIVDTMPYADSYKKEHIPTAVQFEFPIAEMSTMSTDMEKKYIDLLGPDKDRMILVYCGFVKCGRSHNGAMWAVKLGYRNVYRCLGGIRGWKEAGYQMESMK